MFLVYTHQLFSNLCEGVKGELKEGQGPRSNLVRRNGQANMPLCVFIFSRLG